MRESARLGAGSRSGHEVHLSVENRVSPTVMPTEIAMLENNHCYVKLPENQPLALTYVEPRPPLSGKEPTKPHVPWPNERHMAGEVLKAEGSKEKAVKHPEKAAQAASSSQTPKAAAKRPPRKDRSRRKADTPTSPSVASEQRELFSDPPAMNGQAAPSEAWLD